VDNHVGRTAVIADAHPLWLDALEAVLSRLDLTVGGRATSFASAASLVTDQRPDLLVTDYAIAIAPPADEGGVNHAAGLLARARAANPHVKCIVLAEEDDPRERERAFGEGADAFCIKKAESDDLAAVLRQMFSPSFYLAQSGVAAPASLHAEPNGNELAILTKREREILRLAAEGHSNSQLAKMLWVTEQTVKFHLSNIYRKLEVSNRTEASRWAQRHGLLETQPPHAPIAA
jgi:DNA-binding NarL/FixJ family response regulator